MWSKVSPTVLVMLTGRSFTKDLHTSEDTPYEKYIVTDANGDTSNSLALRGQDLGGI